MTENVRGNVSQYFQLVVEKRFGEAEKKLSEIKSTSGKSEHDEGYLKALEGLLLTYRSGNDGYLYLTTIEPTAKNVEALKKEFSDQVAHPLSANYDKGYFSALVHFTKAVGKLKPWREKHSSSKTEKSATADSSETK